jgi:hypothetical protein
MKSEELKNELDRKRAEREERRNRVRTYKDRPIERKDEKFVPENRRIRP